MHFPLSLGIQYCIYKEFSIYAEAYLQTLCFKKSNDTKFFQLKFVFFEKATKFDKISILLLTNKFEFFVSRYSFEHQSGSQSWNFILCDQPNPSKVYLFLGTDKFVLSFLLITNFAGFEN